MRGTDYEQSSVFSYISAERRVPKDHPLRAIRAMADTALKDLSKRFDGSMRRGASVDCAGAAVARAVAAGVVHGAQRTAADGATRLQFPVPLVRGTEYRRPGMGCDGIHQKPRPPA